MKFTVLLTVCGTWCQPGSLIMAVTFTPAIAQNTFSGALPDRSVDDLHSTSLPGEKNDLTLRMPRIYTTAQS